ncbi:MAG TPA: lipid-binding SYLF domain-containing protein [Verrucomicrobiae bacterium]|nr:lipid-binding SYLF domain-containing protein [Verrucomicrobiae bacterium]
MKTLLLGFLMLGCVASALAITPQELDARIAKLADKLDALQDKPDKRIPAGTLAKAKGVILLDRTKAGFIFAYQGGGGVAMVKDASGHWSPVAFVSANEASLGLQIGGEQNFYVILLMSTNATKSLTDSTIDFGGEARGTGGNRSEGKEANFTAEPAVQIYADRTGVFGAAAIKGGAIGPDEKANVAYYHQALTMRDILFAQKVKPSEAATNLAKKLDDYAKSESGKK